MFSPFYSNPDLEVTNLMTKIKNPVDAVNFTVPKVITNRDGIGVYLTRAAAPFPKGGSLRLTSFIGTTATIRIMPPPGEETHSPAAHRIPFQLHSSAPRRGSSFCRDRTRGIRIPPE